MGGVYLAYSWNVLLNILAIIFFIILMVRCYRYAREFDSYLRSSYPDIVEQLRKNYPSWTLNRGLAPLFNVSLIESNIVKDEKLRDLRRKAIWSLVWMFLVMALVCVLSLFLD